MSNPTPLEVLQTISEQTKAVQATLAEVKASNEQARRNIPGAPHIRKGEDPLSSRGYSFLKLFQAMKPNADHSHSKVEIDFHNRLQKYLYDGLGYVRSEANSILAPFASHLLPQVDSESRSFAREIGDSVKAGITGYDPEEVAAIRAGAYGMRRKTLSWTDETQMGSLVAPPLMGELVEVLRNKEVFMAAGARTMGLPPSGRLIFPRQTAASTAYWVGQSQQITDSAPSTGDIILQAKKLACLIKVPNELFRYASVSVEMFLRQDMTKVMGLKLDKELLEGAGSGNSPKGIINYANINTVTSVGTPADGNSGYPLQPEDVALFVSSVEENNAEFRGFVMRPKLWSYIVNRRADAVTGGDHAGPFVFNILRSLGDNMGLSDGVVNTLDGYAVHKSTQLSKTRTRGSGTTNNTYLLGGDFSDYVVALSPTIEFAMTQQGDTAFQNDQTWIRSILPVDGAPLHEASFAFMDNLLLQ